MVKNSKIEWTDHTFSPWIGCSSVSDACKFCYAEAMAKRYGWAEWGNHPRKLTSFANWKKPLQWARVAGVNAAAAADRGEAPPPRPRVFCASLSDVFDNQAPDEWRDRLWQMIDRTPELDWMLLTKRPQNIMKMIPKIWRSELPRHIWVGITAENQTEYDRRTDALQGVPASVHFVSYEPALGPLDITHRLYPTMIICGGEDRARPGRPTNEQFLQWARDLRDQCLPRGVKFFFKQTVGKGLIPADLMIRQLPKEITT